jgi:hypothetical protein
MYHLVVSGVYTPTLTLVANRPPAVAATWTRRGGRTPAAAPLVSPRRPSSRHGTVLLPPIPSSLLALPLGGNQATIATFAPVSSRALTIAPLSTKSHPTLRLVPLNHLHLLIGPIAWR